MIWKEIMLVTIYRLAKQGLSDSKIAEAIGASRDIFKRLKAKRPAIAEALDMARSASDEEAAEDFKSYVFNHLPPELRSLWEDIERFEDENSVERVEALMKRQGLRARQHLFIYALTSSHFDMNLACKKLAMNQGTIKLWIKKDPTFGELLDDIHWHKKNFFEHALIKLVRRGDPSAVIFANKTANRDRYNDKQEVVVSGTIEHKHVVKIRDLKLPLETRRLLLERLRENKQKTIEGKVL